MAIILFLTTKEFEKDLKVLTKKYRSLPSDLEVLKKVLSLHPFAQPNFSFLLHESTSQIQIIKVKKIACRSIPGKGVQTGLRLIYAWQHQKNEIVLLEIYHKNQQTQETLKRIAQHLRAGP
jgi:mRNA-degrading endonuclease RelE of RelBE toxin-antitoxin system